jgi:cupin 2 domain-containing protein
MNNLFECLIESASEEFETLLETGHLKLERIISGGRAAQPGEWYDQDKDEWVVLLKGSAGLSFEDGENTVVMKPGDYIHIPARRRHRVEWTDPTQKTIWLALHFLT